MNMKKKQEYTFQVLISKFLENGKLDEEYLNHTLEIEQLSNNVDIYNAIKHTKRKPTAIVWWAFTNLANFYLRYEGYEGFYASSAQLKKFLSMYGNGYESLAESVKTVKAMREEN